MNLIDNYTKGMGTTDLFDVIPVGKKGTSFERVTSNGSKLVTSFGSNIRDTEIKVAILLISKIFQSLGKKQIDDLRKGYSLETLTEDGQTAYSKPIIVDAKDASSMLYNRNRGLGKRVYTALKHLEDLSMDYSYNGKDESRIRLFQGVAYAKGKIVFNIANFLINRLEYTFKSFRIAPVLIQTGFNMRLSLYVETHQRPMGKYKDSDGVVRTKYAAKNDYYLEDMIKTLRLEGHRENDIIVKLREAFIELSQSEINPIPKFTYNKRLKSFENEHKNGQKHDKLL